MIWIDFIAKANNEIVRLNNDFQDTNKKLDKLNRNLQEAIDEEVEKNRKKEAMLIQQSKMAGIGEMLSSIIHQWKQPLNIINVSSSTLRFSVEVELATKEDTIKSLNHIEKQITLLNETTNEFRDFFKPKDKEEFLINNSTSLIKQLYAKKDIEVRVNCLNDSTCLAYKNELLQVILNMLNNARDQIVSTDTKLKVIDLNYPCDEEFATIEFKDYAGGIKDEVLPSIFDAYFTTKDSDKVNGIRLYMSKTIVEKSGGKIEVSNFNEIIENEDYRGACFKIYIPLKR